MANRECQNAGIMDVVARHEYVKTYTPTMNATCVSECTRTLARTCKRTTCVRPNECNTLYTHTHTLTRANKGHTDMWKNVCIMNSNNSLSINFICARLQECLNGRETTQSIEPSEMLSTCHIHKQTHTHTMIYTIFVSNRANRIDLTLTHQLSNHIENTNYSTYLFNKLNYCNYESVVISNNPNTCTHSPNAPRRESPIPEPLPAAPAMAAALVNEQTVRPSTASTDATNAGTNSNSPPPQRHQGAAASASPSTAPAPSAPVVTIPHTASIMCRICHNSDRLDRSVFELALLRHVSSPLIERMRRTPNCPRQYCRLISPCRCRGTLGYVHRRCLEYWLSSAHILHCELCLHGYNTQTTLR